MSTVTITYCKPCGYLKRAQDAAVALQEQLGLTADLVPGKGGIFEVRVGDAVLVKRAKGYFPDAAEIVAQVRAGLGRGAMQF